MAHDLLADAEARGPRGMAPAEWQARVRLAACYRVFDHLGWTEMIYNHITLRVPDAGGGEPTFLINPFGLNYAEVTARNLIKIGLDGRALEPTDYPVNQAGFVIHSAIHAARPDAHCVMHTHTTAGVAVACKQRGLTHDDFYGATFAGAVAYHDFEGITVHADEGPRLVASLGSKRILILRNHGLLVIGADVFNAFRWMWTLQRACEVQLAVGSLGGADIALTPAIREAVARDTLAFEPREQIERMLFASVLRRARVTAVELVGG